MAVEELGVAEADEELAAGAVGVLGARGGEHAPDVRAVVELGLDLVAGIAGAPAGFVRDVFGERVAALDHEAFHDAMERGAVVEPLAGELLEVLDVAGGDVGPELDDHLAVAGVDEGDFVGGGGGAHEWVQ